MAKLVPDAEMTAANLARMLSVHAFRGHLSTPGSRAAAARRLLEELGIRCDEGARLHDLKGFLISSPFGTEIVVGRDLTDDERLEVYAHLVAHALLGPEHPELRLAARFEYVDGRAPESRPAHELREEVVADAVARAILAGRLEAAPRLIYCRDLGPGRGRFSRAVLRGLHRGSLELYRRSRSYQRLRSLPVVTAFTERVHTFLGNAA
jgi:8-oxo-dGTP pyrophosphatase MutT (NUDIX family)